MSKSDKLNFIDLCIPQDNYTLRDRILRVHHRTVIPKISAEFLQNPNHSVPLIHRALEYLRSPNTVKRSSQTNSINYA